MLASPTPGDLSTKPHHPDGLFPENLSGISSWLGSVSPRVPPPPTSRGSQTLIPSALKWIAVRRLSDVSLSAEED